MISDNNDSLRFLPLGLDIRGKRCLVVGGGPVGARKATTLARAGAEVVVLSPDVAQELAGQIEAGRIRWVKDTFKENHLQGAFLVVAATDDEALNSAVAGSAREKNILVCDASSAERSDVIFGALLQQDDATIAVFTGGRDPAYARRTRDRIAVFLAEGHK